MFTYTENCPYVPDPDLIVLRNHVFGQRFGDDYFSTILHFWRGNQMETDFDWRFKHEGKIKSHGMTVEESRYGKYCEFDNASEEESFLIFYKEYLGDGCDFL